MTHPLTPREKVETSLDDLLRQAVETMKSWTPEQREAHFEAQKKAWVAAEMAFGDEGTRVVTALASGSGDHAELARLAEWRDRLRADPGRAAHFGSPYADRPMQNGRTYWNIDLADDITSLLAENAALRAERDGMVEEVSRSQARLHAATEAGRKLAEAVGIVRLLFEAFPKTKPRESDETEPFALRAARTFLSKEAERG